MFTNALKTSSSLARKRERFGPTGECVNWDTAAQSWSQSGDSESGSEWRHPDGNTPSLLTDRRTGGVPSRCFCQAGRGSNCSAHPSCLRSTASANRRLNCWTDLQFNSFQSSDADKADHRLITELRCDSLVPPERQQDLRRHQNLWGSAQQIRWNSQEAAGEDAELLPHWLHKIFY